MEATVQANKVTLARESRGLTQTELGNRLAVRQGTVSKIEAGLIGVSDDLLAKIATVLDYPPSFFVQTDPIFGGGLNDVYHRKRASVPTKRLKRVYANINVRLMHIARLLRSVELECNIPRLSVDEHRGEV